MDDRADGPASRAPELEDLTGLCRALQEAGARYLLIGGFAVILHGFVRATKDVDLLVDPSPENVRRLKVALSALPDRAVLELEDDEVARYAVVRVADEIVVDLMASACGIDLDEAEATGDVEVVEIEGVPVRLAGKRLLVEMKRTVRPSDAADIAYLEAALRAEQEEE